MISVALCTYNGEKYIEEQLNSILYQTLPVDEIVICDDGSIDNTLEILNQYRNKDARIKVFSNIKNLGLVKNFEKAIRLTSGDFIFLSDQDDVWKEDKVEVMINFFQKKPDCLMLFTNGTLIDERNNCLGSTLWDKWGFNEEVKKSWLNNQNAFLDLIKNYNKVTGATLAFKKELKTVILPITVPRLYWHDTWIAINAAYLNGLYFLEENTINYRTHNKQQIGINVDNQTVDRNSISETKFKKILTNRFPEFSKNVALIPGKKKLHKRIIKKIKNIFR